ncbi:hypothetical protein CALVIDRAFT_474019, partial [Calocera viscosa TUFC12733]
LSKDDKLLFKGFYNKMNAHLSNAQYESFSAAYPEVFPRLSYLERRVESVSGIKNVSYDCCINSCAAYTGGLTNLEACPHCNAPRFKPDGKPVRQYQYLPLIPQLQGQYANAERAALLSSYRARQDPHSLEMTDVFQGKIYRELRKRYIFVNDQTLKTRYFDAPQDIAMGLSTDGFGPFK